MEANKRNVYIKGDQNEEIRTEKSKGFHCAAPVFSVRKRIFSRQIQRNDAGALADPVYHFAFYSDSRHDYWNDIPTEELKAAATPAFFFIAKHFYQKGTCQSRYFGRFLLFFSKIYFRWKK